MFYQDPRPCLPLGFPTVPALFCTSFRIEGTWNIVLINFNEAFPNSSLSLGFSVVIWTKGLQMWDRTGHVLWCPIGMPSPAGNENSLAEASQPYYKHNVIILCDDVRVRGNIKQITNARGISRGSREGPGWSTMNVRDLATEKEGTPGRYK